VAGICGGDEVMTDTTEELSPDLRQAELNHLRQWVKRSRRDRPREREAARADNVIFQQLDNVINAAIDDVRYFADVIHADLIQHGEVDAFFLGYPPDGRLKDSPIYQQFGIDPFCYTRFFYPTEREREPGMFRHAVFNPANAPTYQLKFMLFAKPNKLPAEMPDDESAKRLLSLLSGQGEIATLRRLVRAAIDEPPAGDAAEFASWFAEWRGSAQRLFNRGTPILSWRTHWYQATQDTYSDWADASKAFDVARHKLEGLDAVGYTVEVSTTQYKHADINTSGAKDEPHSDRTGGKLPSARGKDRAARRDETEGGGEGRHAAAPAR
jgi:hypothetical protein